MFIPEKQPIHPTDHAAVRRCHGCLDSMNAQMFVAARKSAAAQRDQQGVVGAYRGEVPATIRQARKCLDIALDGQGIENHGAYGQIRVWQPFMIGVAERFGVAAQLHRKDERKPTHEMKDTSKEGR